MLITINDLPSIRKQHSTQKLVLTSGTFDLIHIGHLNFLENAKKYGDILVVLMSGDNRVRARKGSTRPIINETERARILDALKVVDYVFIDPSMLGPNETDSIHAEIIKLLQPDYYVTDGPDPRFIELVDKSKFIIIDRNDASEQKSTTEIIEHIVNISK